MIPKAKTAVQNSRSNKNQTVSVGVSPAANCVPHCLQYFVFRSVLLRKLGNACRCPPQIKRLAQQLYSARNATIGSSLAAFPRRITAEDQTYAA
jgi:hypothetical protein